MHTTKLIAGIPSDELDRHNARVREMKIQGFELALDVARMDEETRRYTGYKSGDNVLICTARDIEKLIVALERKYPA